MAAMTLSDGANATLFRMIEASQPRLIGLAPAIDVVPGLTADLILHAGPPITWDRMPSAMQSAVAGALVFEGRTADLDAATRLAASGTIQYAPAHDHQSVGAMAGVITASMPVFIVEDETSKLRSFVTVNEGLGKALRFGANGPDVLRRLDYIRRMLAPLLNRALAIGGPIDLKSLIAEALRRGDECHNRNKAATSLFLREIAPALVETQAPHAEIAAALRFIAGNDHFFLSLSMAHAKAITLGLERAASGSLVTVMAGNGREIGIRTSGSGQRWFTAPAEVADVRLFDGHSIEEATPTMGDSYVTEAIGLGGFALAAAPAIAEFIGGSVDDLAQRSDRMRDIAVGEHSHFVIPQLAFRGVPSGIDVHRVASQRTTPTVNTGVASRHPGVGQIGAGVQSFPLAPFVEASEFLRRAQQ
jgi:hypothetical protein